MPTLPPNIVITPAQADDIPAMVNMPNLAFGTDSHTEMKEFIKGQPVFEEKSHSAYLKGLMEHPRVTVLVARDTSVHNDTPSTTTSDSSAQGLVVGSIIWVFRNFDVPLSETRTAPNVESPKPSPPPFPGHQPLTVKDLEAMTDKSIREWQEYFCPPDVRCRFIAGWTVRPDYQGQGIGGALMRWGTKKCDEDGVYSWVQGSMGSKGAYEAAGFSEVGRLELDLDMFSEGRGRPDGGKWGRYIWPYMKRDPVT